MSRLFFPLKNKITCDNPEFYQLAKEQRKLFLGISFWQETLDKLDCINKIINAHSTRGDFNILDDQAVNLTLPDYLNLNPLIKELAVTLKPWRKGPFAINDLFIDSEWRSWMKWQRIMEGLKIFNFDLKSKSILDIGCNNGYYLFRMLPFKPEIALGIDPNARFLLQFELINTLMPDFPVYMEPISVEHLELFKEPFDIIFCLGVIYHRKDPIKVLKNIRSKIKKNGLIVIESITVPANELSCSSQVLIPKDRYCMMNNVYQVPTEKCLITWLQDVGFTDIKVIDSSKTTVYEQRKTDFADFYSLSDFLNPLDHSKTIEGYPAPWRSLVFAIA